MRSPGLLSERPQAPAQWLAGKGGGRGGGHGACAGSSSGGAAPPDQGWIRGGRRAGAARETGRAEGAAPWGWLLPRGRTQRIRAAPPGRRARRPAPARSQRVSEAVPRGKSQVRAGSSPLVPQACSSPQRRPRGQARAAPQTLAAAPRLRCPPPCHPPPPAIGACAMSLPGRTSQLAGQTPLPHAAPREH